VVTGRTLLTGADGYLGGRLAARLLAETDDQLTLTVRAGDSAELAAKRESLLAVLRDRAAGADPGRVEVLAADLRDAEPFAAVDPRRVTRVVHAAARTAFNVEREVARRVNTAGTLRVAEYARRCPGLGRLLVLSTLFSAGRRVGVVAEEPPRPEAGFVNCYEWSKCAAEREVLAGFADLPVTVARLTTVVADDDTGAVTQYNAFHNTLKLFFYGLLSVLPGDRATPQYLATADFSVRGLAHLARPEEPAGVYHLAPGPAEAIPLGEVIDAAFEVFEADAGYRRRRLLRPEFCDIDSFGDLVEAAGFLPASPMAQALGSVAPFAEQLFLPKDFDNSRLRATWAGYPRSDLRALVAATCRRLVGTRWGRAAVLPRRRGGTREEAP
jgi:nucleoside-diphosphate-sugar epimerase